MYITKLKYLYTYTYSIITTINRPSALFLFYPISNMMMMIFYILFVVTFNNMHCNMCLCAFVYPYPLIYIIWMVGTTYATIVRENVMAIGPWAQHAVYASICEMTTHIFRIIEILFCYSIYTDVYSMRACNMKPK